MAAPVQEVTRKSVIIPEQTPKSVRDAFDTARALGGPLATFKETIGALKALKDARGNYVLAVDPKDLPKKAGWYRVERADEVSFVPILATTAQKLRSEGRLYDVLYVGESAVNAAKEGRPVALDVDYDDVDYDNVRDWFLVAYDWPDYGARVALSSQAAPQANAVPAALLRRAQEQLNKINETARDDATDAIEEVLRRVA